MDIRKSKVFIQSNHNRPSGGTKVTHQLARLFRGHGIEAHIFSPAGEVYEPDWMSSTAPVISNERMRDMCSSLDIVIGNWPDFETSAFIRDCPAQVKIFYPQCNFFLRGKHMIGNDIFKTEWGYNGTWAVSESNKNILDARYGTNCTVVHPYFEHERFQPDAQNAARSGILSLSRKGNRHVRFIAAAVGGHMTVLRGRFTEQEFIDAASRHSLFLHTALGYQPDWSKKIRAWGKYIMSLGAEDRITQVTYAGSKYDEGFPLPPAEAALVGCVVVGFAKNGDLEWMDDDNTFIARDRSYFDLYRQVRRALSTPEPELHFMNARARQRLQTFTGERTWAEITSFFDRV